MSEQSQTTKAPSDPVLCKMGCGFFGSNATGDCCSKCYSALKKDGASAAAPVVKPAPLETTVEEEPTPMEIEETMPKELVPSEAPVKDAAPKKRKKKKANYKNMMAGMMKPTSPSKDIEKEKETLRKVTGGGAFCKIDKI